MIYSVMLSLHIVNQTVFQNMEKQRDAWKQQLVSIHHVLLQMRSLVLKREAAIKVDETFAKNKVYRWLPVKQLGPATDLLFDSPETQRVLQELIIKRLMLKGINEPDEHDVVAVAFDTLLAQGFQAHMHWREPLRDP